MDYISSIIWFLSWPLLIFVSYRLVLFALKRSKMLNQNNE